MGGPRLDGPWSPTGGGGTCSSPRYFSIWRTLRISVRHPQHFRPQWIEPQSHTPGCSIHPIAPSATKKLRNHRTGIDRPAPDKLSRALPNWHSRGRLQQYRDEKGSSSNNMGESQSSPAAAHMRVIPVTRPPVSWRPSKSGASPPSAPNTRKRRPLSTSSLPHVAALAQGPEAAAEDENENDSGDEKDKPKIEQLLINHIRFAHAFKKNDTALIVPFLDRNVTMRTMDGASLEGQSAVLAHLVGQRMTKLSANLHVKGCPARTGLWQSSFVYEHGILFKDPLYIEVLDWKSPTTIGAISHVPLPDAKGNKCFQEFLRSSPLTSKLRRSFGDSRRSMASDVSDDDSSRSSSASVKLDDEHDSEGADVTSGHSAGQPEEEAASSLREACGSRRFSCSDKTIAMIEAAKTVESTAAATSMVTTRPRRQRLSSGDSTSSSSVEASAPPSPFDDDAPVFILAELAVMTELTPIRKRKGVNPFVVLHCTSTGAVWKSPIRKRQRSPRWTNIPLSFPVRSTNDVLEVSLWDQAFLRSTKVASTKVLVSELLKGELAYLAAVEMDRVEFADKSAAAVRPDEQKTIRVQLDFRRRLKMDRNSLFETHISSGDEEDEELELKAGGECKRRPSTEQDDARDTQLATNWSVGHVVCEHMSVSVAVLVTLIAWAIFYVKMYVVHEAAQQ